MKSNFKRVLAATFVLATLIVCATYFASSRGKFFHLKHPFIAVNSAHITNLNSGTEATIIRIVDASNAEHFLVAVRKTRGSPWESVFSHPTNPDRTPWDSTFGYSFIDIHDLATTNSMNIEKSNNTGLALKEMATILRTYGAKDPNSDITYSSFIQGVPSVEGLLYQIRGYFQ